MGFYMFTMFITLVIGGSASLYVNHMLKKYSNVPTTTGLTGSQMARRMTLDKGIPQVGILPGGPNVDHFDPRTNSVTLGTEAYNVPSVTAIATAVHEVGHACQYAEGYTFMKLRSAMVPVVNLASNGWMIVFFIGLAMGASGMGTAMVKLGIIMFAAVLVFHLVTLPVEFDASRRGLAYLQQIGVNQTELQGAHGVLRACALTYVAAALTALLQLLYMLAISRDN
ncbi:Putative neutral zinc metallopeptidase [Slackia heliotrinireducens]|uniref:Predicted Zn-dependent protease n=1 Tax=Slackia heliotrinireducens (strain ATCC 29202 / DSM 20476 / NCTC 11029 / RHS 1) TaxID=471855 RepID=C7N5R0_SLAHD|nr:zinc metallopeptidase [Slackia heliotrinireducens]ACV22245.1 predicted Zn-dependent protease [Slackia heliotrinireducens DSM 20476]VEH00391.1 Putative neutral zinc metallopeptidase [Slackia heliotrinireducens]